MAPKIFGYTAAGNVIGKPGNAVDSPNQIDPKNLPSSRRQARVNAIAHYEKYHSERTALFWTCPDGLSAWLGNGTIIGASKIRAGSIKEASV